MTYNREHIYSLPNTSCTLKAIAILQKKYQGYIDSVAVINLIDGWLVRLSLESFTSYRLEKNLRAVLSEMGSVAQPSGKIRAVLNSLDRGEQPTDVMNRYQVVIVAHGKPETEEIEIFRDRVIDGLGYCPQNMA